jgi:cellulose biosynthesis protein BcsQ/tetratricopeptide (TPR) repeat protein
MDSQPPLGRVLTFYSYKGGTGRSMALANVAWILASAGRKVLVIDWDLEAPGLHRYFRPFLIDDELAASDGLIELVDNYANEAIRPVDPDAPPAPDWYIAYADFRDYVVSVNFDYFPGGGKIDFLPAGRQNDRYAITVNSFNWQNFYDRLGGGGFFEAVKTQARAHYDYVLIDSRTGVSDTAGICSVQMPDSLVVCFTYNNQSIKGAVAVAQSAVRMRRKLDEQRREQRRAVAAAVAGDNRQPFAVEDTPAPYRMFPVGMRVDAGESDRLAVRQWFARASFADLVTHIPASSLHEYWTGVEIPQTPFYAYEEVLATFKDDPRDPKTVLAAFVRVVGHITDGDVTEYHLTLSPGERQRRLAAFAATPQTLAPNGSEAPRETDEDALARTAEFALAELTDADTLVARRVFGRLVRLVPDEEGRGYVPIRVSFTDFSRAEVAVIQKLADRGLLAVSSDRSRPSPRLSGDTAAQRSPAAEQTVALADTRLPSAWKRLTDWLDGDRDFLLWRQQLRAYLLDWQRSGRDRGALLGGQLLNDADHWRLARPDDLNDAETRYIVKSRAEATAGTRLPRRRRLITAVAVIAAMLVVPAAVLLSVRWYRSSRQPPVAAPVAPTTNAMMQIAEAARNRDAGRVADAITNLSDGLTALAGADRALTEQMYRDRAYNYKLAGDWEHSIADLTSALSIDEALGNPQRVSLLRDRAFGNFRIRDLELALADYQALAAANPTGSTLIRDFLSDTLRAHGGTRPFVFMFTESGPLHENTPAVIPASLRKLGRLTDFINLRFWWYPVAAAEMRYTDAYDAGLANQAAEIVRAGGFTIGPPVLLSTVVQRSRRIEVWFPRGK